MSQDVERRPHFVAEMSRHRCQNLATGTSTIRPALLGRPSPLAAVDPEHSLYHPGPRRTIRDSHDGSGLARLLERNDHV
jgi:hypothetical protein